MNSDWCLSDEDLALELGIAKDRMEELTQEKQSRDLWSPQIRLARNLHRALCRGHHCDFFYQNWSENIMAGLAEPQQYYNMAQEFLSNFSETDVARIVTILGRK